MCVTFGSWPLSTQPNSLEISPCCCMCCYFIPLYRGVVFHGMGMNHSLFNHWPTNGHVGCSVFPYCKGSHYTHLSTSFCMRYIFITQGSLCKSIAGSNGKYIFSFTRKGWTLFRTGCFHQQCMGDPRSPHPHPSCLLSLFFAGGRDSDWCVVIAHCDCKLHFPNG